VRLALAFKALPYKYSAVSLLKGEHRASEYAKLNAMLVVPTLLHQGVPINQSLAICEYLEETFPETRRLLPTTPRTFRACSLCISQRTRGTGHCDARRRRQSHPTRRVSAISLAGAVLCLSLQSSVLACARCVWRSWPTLSQCRI
jgi:glutathione S-transferase